MGAVNGQLCTCDRCGAEVFRKHIGEEVMDGGHTKWNKFEPMPDGWGTQIHMGLLCPDCNKEYMNMINAFKGYRASAQSLSMGE